MSSLWLTVFSGQVPSNGHGLRHLHATVHLQDWHAHCGHIWKIKKKGYIYWYILDAFLILSIHTGRRNFRIRRVLFLISNVFVIGYVSCPLKLISYLLLHTPKKYSTIKCLANIIFYWKMGGPPAVLIFACINVWFNH